jgi:hypothetical protein
MRDAIFLVVNCSYLHFPVLDNKNKVNNGPRNCSRFTMKKELNCFSYSPNQYHSLVIMVIFMITSYSSLSIYVLEKVVPERITSPYNFI